MGPLTVGFPPGKKFSQLCCEKFFPLHGRVRGPMGPPTFTQPGTQGPLLLPRRGPWGPPMGPFSRKKIFAALPRKFFSASQSSSGAHGAPYFYPVGDPGPPTLPSRGPWGPPQLCFLPEKNFRRLCRRKFFSASQSCAGAHGAPVITKYFHFISIYFHFFDIYFHFITKYFHFITKYFHFLSKKYIRGPWGPLRLCFLPEKNFRRLCRRKIFSAFTGRFLNGSIY